MAGVEPYAPCPCGSGEKFKWCCQKVEAFADRAQRMFDTGQAEGAIKVLDEGLVKDKGNPWLLTRKAIMQIRANQPEPAKASLRQVLERNPKHIGALVLLTRCVLETEGPVNGAGTLQQALAAVDDADRPKLAGIARVIAYMLGEFRRYVASIKHLELVLTLGDADDSARSALRNLEASPAVSPAFKDRFTLLEAAPGIPEDIERRFDDALDLADQGLWASAAGGFYHLSVSDPGGDADYNLGVCRLWLGDEEGAVAPLRRYSKRLGQTVEAVDLEILCQQLDPTHPDDKVERIQLTWPLRNRDALIANLRAAKDAFDLGVPPLDPEDPDAAELPEVHTFVLLDRPNIEPEAGKPVRPEDIPLVLGRVEIEADTVGLEAHDDGRIDVLGDRFTALAGNSIAPAHPRTKILGEDSRSTLALTWEWLHPPGMTREEARRLNNEKRTQVIDQVWTRTPMPYLGFRSPIQAGKDGDATVPLRAAVCQFEQESQADASVFEAINLRARLNIPLEPAIDPETVEIGKVSVARLADIPTDLLDDARLVALFRRARQLMASQAIEKAAREIVQRPAIFDRGEIDPVSVYSTLSTLAAGLGRREEAMDWAAKGRQADSPASRAQNAAYWDMVELRLKAAYVSPEVWVPELAILLDRYSQDPTANRIVLMNLVEMKLINLTPNPDNPDDVLLDSRPLQAVMATYGPRVTTASGRLGISATKPDVWTPGGQAAGSSGGIWTPGSGSGPQGGGDKPKLILPGR